MSAFYIMLGVTIAMAVAVPFGFIAASGMTAITRPPKLPKRRPPPPLPPEVLH